MLADLIYTAKGKITYTRVIELEPIRLEGSYTASGKLRNGMEVNEYCTYQSMIKYDNINYGEGKHLLITSNNGIIRWVGRGFGRYINNKHVWRGSGIFESRDLAEFNAIVGVVEAEIVDGNIEISVWEWR